MPVLSWASPFVTFTDSICLGFLFWLLGKIFLELLDTEQ